MGVMSKYFYEFTNGLTCRQLVHPWTGSCREAALHTLLPLLLGNLKFFAPVILLPLATRYKRMSKHLIKEAAIDYLYAVANGTVLAFFIVIGMCASCKIFGKIVYPMCISAGSFIGILPMTFSPRTLFVSFLGYFGNMFFEAVVRKTDSRIISVLRRSKPAGTVLFMCLSSTIVWLMQKMGRRDVFWFIKPAKKNLDLQEANQLQKVCSHVGSCDSYILEGIITYSELGLLLEIVRNLASNVTLLNLNLAKTSLLVFKRVNFKLIAFLTTYAATYRTSTCLLNNFYETESDTHLVTAAFLAGSAYSIFPAYETFSLGVSTVSRLIYNYCLERNVVERKRGKRSKMLRRVIRGVPYLIYAVCVTYVAHTRIFYPFASSKLAIKVIDGTSAGLSRGVGKRIAKLWLLGNALA